LLAKTLTKGSSVGWVGQITYTTKDRTEMNVSILEHTKPHVAAHKAGF
jgi:hypothetical protein